jgi:hypothetical protein
LPVRSIVASLRCEHEFSTSGVALLPVADQDPFASSAEDAPKRAHRTASKCAATAGLQGQGAGIGTSQAVARGGLSPAYRSMAACPGISFGIVSETKLGYSAVWAMPTNITAAQAIEIAAQA